MEATLRKRAGEEYKESPCPWVVVFLEVVTGDTPLEFVVDDTFCAARVVLLLYFGVDWPFTWLGMRKATRTIPRQRRMI